MQNCPHGKNPSRCSINLQRLVKAGTGSSWVFKVAQIHNEISCTLNFRSTHT